MIMAGRLTGTVDGRPVVIDADDSGLTVVITALRTAWALRGAAKTFVPVLRLVRYGEVPVRVTIAGFLKLEILPKPSALARLFVPSLTSLA